MISHEKTTADRIKSRVNRQSVQGALTSLLEYLKTLKEIPANGLLLWWSDNPNARHSLVPPVSNYTRIYQCDRRFDTTVLRSLIDSLDEKDTYAILASTGDEYCLAVAGPTSVRARILSRDEVYIRNKHGRGGQSSVRFERLADESRQKAASKIVDECKSKWLNSDGRPSVKHLFLIGPDEWRRLTLDRMRLECSVLAEILRESLTPSASNLIEDSLTKALGSIRAYNSRITGSGNGLLEQWLRTDTDRLVFGSEHILRALSDGVVEYLLVDPELEIPEDLVNNAGSVERMPTGLEGYSGLVALVYKGTYIDNYLPNDEI